MSQIIQTSGELSQESPRPRRTPRRQAKAAEGWNVRSSRSEARRGFEAPAAKIRQPRDSADAIHERRMTLGLRTSIGAAMAGLTLFFHAPLGAALAGLFNQ